jgi:hypothetical protein
MDQALIIPNSHAPTGLFGDTSTNTAIIMALFIILLFQFYIMVIILKRPAAIPAATAYMEAAQQTYEIKLPFDPAPSAPHISQAFEFQPPGLPAITQQEPIDNRPKYWTSSGMLHDLESCCRKKNKADATILSNAPIPRNRNNCSLCNNG